jgi:hypothetical protein
MGEAARARGSRVMRAAVFMMDRDESGAEYLEATI